TITGPIGDEMPESVMDQIVSELRENGETYYPGRGGPRNVRVVGHTPKTDHYIYDLVLDFNDGGERIAAKIYRPNKCGPKAARGWTSRPFAPLFMDHVPP